MFILSECEIPLALYLINSVIQSDLLKNPKRFLEYIFISVLFIMMVRK